MQQHIKFLVVEDEIPWSLEVTSKIRGYFEERLGINPSRIRPASAYDGDQGNQQLTQGRFDLVTLDMNLGEGASRSKISGLDLLAEIAEGNRAYFVIIITGAVNDPKLEQLYGKDAAALMRYGAINEAIKQLPAERVRILHKPAKKTVAEAAEELTPHLYSALDQYCAVSLERNIFRPLPGHSTLWEVRYNGGPRLTIPRIQPFEMIRSALAQPNQEMKIIQLVQAIAHNSGKAGAVRSDDSLPQISHLEEDDEDAPDWTELAGMSVPDHSPVDTDEGTITLEVLLGGLLQTQRQGLPISDTVKFYAEHYGIGPLLLLPTKAREYSRNRVKAEELFALEDAAEKLTALYAILVPLLKPYRDRYQLKEDKRTPPKKHGVSTGKTRVAWGNDTPELRLARAHWKRARAALRKYPALKDFVHHIETCVARGLTDKGHIHYLPTDGSELTPFWLTQ